MNAQKRIGLFWSAALLLVQLNDDTTMREWINKYQNAQRNKIIMIIKTSLLDSPINDHDLANDVTVGGGGGSPHPLLMS